MTNDEAMFESLCLAQFEILDAYEKHVEELTRIGAPEYIFALLAEEQERVIAELQSRIKVLSDKLYG